MNILFINHEIGGGGATHSLLELIEEFLERGHNIYVLTPFKDGSFADEIRRLPVTTIVEPFWWWRIHIDGIKLRMKIRIKWFTRKKSENDAIARKIARYALDNHIDIIHSNTTAVDIGALISKYSGIPHVWHIREFGDIDMDMHFFAPESKAYQFMNMYTQKFICVSRAVADHYFKLDSQKKIVVYNGVSTKYIIDPCSRNNRKKEDVVNILIAGAVCPSKGQDEAVKACNMLLKHHTNNFMLYIVGRGKMYFDIPVELKNHVKLVGEISNIQAFRKNMDIELICSKCEAFGRVTVEAMLGGLAVIGTDCGGTPELIKDKYNGYLYKRENISQLCDLLKYLIDNPEIRKTVGITAQKYVEDNFLICRCADEIESLYREICTKI